MRTTEITTQAIITILHTSITTTMSMTTTTTTTLRTMTTTTTTTTESMTTTMITTRPTILKLIPRQEVGDTELVIVIERGQEY